MRNTAKIETAYTYSEWCKLVDRHGKVLRHGLTRSIKVPDKLQLTCILVKDGEEIPLSDLQVNLYEFLKETPTNAKVIIE